MYARSSPCPKRRSLRVVTVVARTIDGKRSSSAWARPGGTRACPSKRRADVGPKASLALPACTTRTVRSAFA